MEGFGRKWSAGCKLFTPQRPFNSQVHHESAMSEQPLFDSSLKKRKKKTVAFSEDPLGADADPTTPAPDFIDTTTTNGDAVDLGPTTAHEAMKLDNEQGKKEEEDLQAMFGDLKKKKKKKEIPMDLVCILLLAVY